MCYGLLVTLFYIRNLGVEMRFELDLGMESLNSTSLRSLTNRE